MRIEINTMIILRRSDVGKNRARADRDRVGRFVRGRAARFVNYDWSWMDVSAIVIDVGFGRRDQGC